MSLNQPNPIDAAVDAVLKERALKRSRPGASQASRKGMADAVVEDIPRPTRMGAPLTTAPVMLPGGITRSQGMLTVNRLSRPPEYARPLRPHWVAQLARTWDDLEVGEVVVSLRADGTYRLLTGNHRWAAKVMQQDFRYRFPCLIYTGLTLEQEALIYLSQDRNRLRHTVADDFQALLEAKDPLAVGIKGVLDGLGLEVTPYGDAGWAINRIRAVGGLIRATETTGLDNLRSALLLIRDEWAINVSKTSHTRKSPYAESSVVPLSVFLKLYSGVDSPLDLSKLRESMRRERMEGYEARYMRHRIAATSRPTAGLAALYGVLSFVDLYNYNRRPANRLTDHLARQASETRFGGKRENVPYANVERNQVTRARRFVQALGISSPGLDDLAADAADGGEGEG